jgi:hypothetical protein
LGIRELPTFHDLNSAIRDLPKDPDESKVAEIQRKYLNHLVMLRGFLGIKGFRRVLLNTWINIHPRLKYFGVASSVLGFATLQPAVAFAGSMIGGLLAGVAFLKSPNDILEKKYTQNILQSSSNQKEKQFRVSSVSGNIGHKAKQSNEKGPS